MNAQTSASFSNSFQAGVYLETYWGHDFPRSSSGRRTPFLVSHTDLGGLRVNLLSVQAAYLQPQWEVRTALMAGSYSDQNLPAEPLALRRIMEASLKMYLNRRKTLQAITGIFPSHIGAETARGWDCFTLTRSFQAENSPYYESGIRVQWHSTHNPWSGAFLLLNGWQRSRIESRFRIPAVGYSIAFQKESWFWASHGFLGPADPSNPQTFRLFNNFILGKQFSEAWDALLVADVGWAPYVDGGVWWSPCGMVRWRGLSKWALAFRMEGFSDPARVITPSSMAFPLNVAGISLNADWNLAPGILWRAEWRGMAAPQKIYETSEPNASHVVAGFTTALIIDFSQTFQR